MILSSYGQCKQLNISFWWWCRGVGNLVGMENCSHSRWCSLCLGSRTLPMGVSSHRISLYWKRELDQMKGWFFLESLESHNETIYQRAATLGFRAEWRTWHEFFWPACFQGVRMKEWMLKSDDPRWWNISSLPSLAPCILQHIMYITMYIDPTLFPRSNHHQLPNLIPIFHKMIFSPKLQLAI